MDYALATFEINIISLIFCSMVSSFNLVLKIYL